jgi:hypothetical protein
VEAGQPICANCKQVKAAEAMKAAGVPMAGSPLNFKNKGLDDDPLGLLGMPSKPTAPKVEPPAAAPPPLSSVPPPAPPVTLTPSGPMPPKTVAFTPSPTASIPLSLDGLGAAPNPLGHSPGPQPKPSLDLDSMMNNPQPLKPVLPKASVPTPTPEPLPVVSAPTVPFPAVDDGIEAPKKKNKFFSLAKVWVKFLIRRFYEMFDPLAQKLKVPTYVFLGLIAILIVGAFIGVGAMLNKPSVALADTIQPIHMIQVNSTQVSEMDITAYTELQTQLQTTGFTPVIQMTVPQLPSPNFFDVGMKEDAGTYSEILKMPGQIAPHLSFVSVFSNGVWFSTNAWDGDNQTMDYLVSEYYPNDTPDQLYVQHIQSLEKLKQDKGWQVQTMGENRYMAALSDHLRWFLNKKDIQGYQADFKLWH